MQDSYAGDTPDFGKFTLLRSVAGNGDGGPRLRLGVNWYYTLDVDPDHTSDGDRRNHTKDRTRFRFIDPDVWDCLEPIQNNRSVAALEEELEKSGVLRSDTLYYSEPVPVGRPRDKWFKRGLSVLKDASVVFFDPDTGLEVLSMSYDQAPKYALYSELAPHTTCGQTVIAYQHQPHKKLELCVPEIANRIRSDGGFEGHIEAIKFGGGGSVIYFIMCNTAHRDLIVHRLEGLIERGREEYVRVPTGLG